MGNDTVDPGNRRARAWELSEELRRIVEALAVCDVAPDQLDAATRLARELRSRLGGPPRSRWYDADEDTRSLGPESRSAYLEQSPIRGRNNPIAPPLVVDTIEREGGDRGVMGRARLGMAYEGPPHGVHGGWIAALFDELLGSAQGLTTSPGVTAKLTIRYRQITPIDADLRFEGWIARDEGRGIVAKATCHVGNTLTADAEGLFVRVDFNQIEERMQRRSPKAE